MRADREVNEEKESETQLSPLHCTKAVSFVTLEAL